MTDANVDLLRKMADFITDSIVELAIIGGYIWLVFDGKASIEGFLVLAMYVIKKKLDLKEEQNGGVK
jgi:hypothetical protein